MQRFIRMGDLSSKPGRSGRLPVAQATLYRKIKAGLFVDAVHLGDNVSAWPLDEVEAIEKAWLAGRSDDEIRALVAELHAKRTAGTAPAVAPGDRHPIRRQRARIDKMKAGAAAGGSR